MCFGLKLQAKEGLNNLIFFNSSSSSFFIARFSVRVAGAVAQD